MFVATKDHAGYIVSPETCAVIRGMVGQGSSSKATSGFEDECRNRIDLQTIFVDVPCWQVAESDLTSQRVYDSPYKDVTITAAFAGPQGQSIAREAFWCGQKTGKRDDKCAAGQRGKARIKEIRRMRKQERSGFQSMSVGLLLVGATYPLCRGKQWGLPAS